MLLVLSLFARKSITFGMSNELLPMVGGIHIIACMAEKDIFDDEGSMTSEFSAAVGQW
jgi:hypothetical protein